ncbi:MAG: WYL domain-containing protein [Planctomycetaceae bacterium]|jgi:predicted DNA-binding transcriptional regulator YafY|nr:WYL domain-containing protein [Planctomycetaceae bacterium]
MNTTLNPSARQRELIALLSGSPKGLPIETLAKELGVSTRTVNRYLATLHNDLPVQQFTQKHGRILWKLDKNIHDAGEPSVFTFDEVAAIDWGCRFLEPLANTDLGDAAHSALKKIRKQLGSVKMQRAERMLGTFHEIKRGWSNYSKQSGILRTLMNGCEDEREVNIRYQSNFSTQEKNYSIHPYEFATYEGTLYLIGFSCERQMIVTWKTNRITFADLTAKKFTKPKKNELAKYYRNSFGVFITNEPAQKVRIRIAPEMARYVQEHHWHETQKFKVQENQSIIIEFELAPTRELINWILKFGKSAEVLKPLTLRQKIKDEITEMLKLYNIENNTK